MRNALLEEKVLPQKVLSALHIWNP